MHGGLWIDSTTYMTGTIPAYIDDSNFFVYRNGWMDMEMINMGSWLIFSKYTNNIILLETQSLLYAYWKKYNYIKNYFLMHIFFRMVTDANNQSFYSCFNELLLVYFLLHIIDDFLSIYQ